MKKKEYQVSYPISEIKGLMSKAMNHKEIKAVYRNFEKRAERRMKKLYKGDWKTAGWNADVIGESIVFTMEGTNK